MNDEEKQEFKEEIVGYIHEARRFKPKKLTDWLDLGIKASIFGGILLGGLSVGVPLAFPKWASAPDKIEANTTAIENTNEAIELLSSSLALVRPQVIDFKGNLIVSQDTVEAGNTIGVAMVVRRNVSCDTLVRVRFYNHRTNNIQTRQSYDIRAVKSPVSAIFSGFSLQLFIPEDLPPGTYSYFPELVPIDCGVYEPVVSPMSLPFEVTAAG